MPKTYKLLLSLVNSGVYSAHQARAIYALQTYSVDFKASEGV